MTRPDCITTEYWDALPAELRPGLSAIVAGFLSRITAQDARVAELEVRLNQSSASVLSQKSIK